MTDRIPGAPGRCKAVVTGEELQKMQAGEEFAITLRRDDQPIKEGTPYNKASVLPDELADALCPGLQDPAPKDALLALQAQKADTGRPITGNDIAISDGAEAPLRGLRIFGYRHGFDEGAENVVGGKGSVTVNVMGKNIADVRKFSANSTISTPTSNVVLSNSYGTTISANTGDSITVTQSKYSGSNGSYQNGFFSIGFYCPLKVGDIITISFDYEITNNPKPSSLISVLLHGQSLNQSWVATTLRKYTTTVTESMVSTDNWNYLEVRLDGKSGVFSNFQIEYGSTYTGFEPYKAPQTLTVPTPDGLEGDGILCDEIDLAKGVLIRRVLENSETPLPEDVLEAYAHLRTYTSATRITNDEGAQMEVLYCTASTAVTMAQNPKNRGKFLTIDRSGCVVPEKIEAYVDYTEKADGWVSRLWSDGFAELYLRDSGNAGSYTGPDVALQFSLPFPMASNAMVQVTAPGRFFLTDCSIAESTNLNLCFAGEGELNISDIHIYVAGYMA